MTDSLMHRLVDAGLSLREIETVDAILAGCSNNEAAERLSVVEKTIKFHLSNIYRKLKLKSRTQLIVFCSNLELRKEPEEGPLLA